MVWIKDMLDRPLNMDHCLYVEDLKDAGQHIVYAIMSNGMRRCIFETDSHPEGYKALRRYWEQLDETLGIE